MSFKSIADAINSLNDDDKEIIIKKFKNNWTFEMIGKTYKVHPSIIKARIDAIIFNLRESNQFNKILSITVDEHNQIVRDIRKLYGDESKSAIIDSIENKVSAMPIDKIGLKASVSNRLKKAGIHNTKILTTYTYDKLIRIKGIGETSILHIIRVLADHGLSLKE